MEVRAFRKGLYYRQRHCVGNQSASELEVQEDLVIMRIGERSRWEVYNVEAPEMVTESCRDGSVSNSLRSESTPVTNSQA